MCTFQMPAADSNTTVAAPAPPHIHAHAHPHHHHGFRHHKLTALHNPHLSGLLSSESSESGEVASNAAAVVGTPSPAADSSASNSEATPEADAPAPIVKRDAPVESVLQANPVLLVPLCPGRVRHF